MKIDIKSIFKKQYWLIITIAVLVLYLVIFLFFKPNPKVRVDWNKIQINKSNSTLVIEAPDEINGVGKTFKAFIKMDTHNYFVNAVQVYVKYDPKVLQINKTNTDDSFCKFYPENNFSNEKGLIKLSCGAQYPGFKGSNTIQTIEFLTKAIKTTDLSITKDSMVLANDGKGTNLLKDFALKSIVIKAGL